MNNKIKSFIIHKDSLGILDQLTLEQCGKLFLACRDFNLGKELNLDETLALVFFPFKAQFIRDNEKYMKTCERRAIAGSMGGKQKVANASKCKQELPKVADNKNKSKSKSNNKSDSNVEEVINYLNHVIQGKYKATTKSHIDNISARLNEGHTVNDFKLVIDSKYKEWINTNSAQYLRPSTLFQAGKFQGYLLAAKPMTNSNSPREFSQ